MDDYGTFGIVTNFRLILESEYFLLVAQQTCSDIDFTIVEVSRSYSGSPRSVGTPVDEGSACRGVLYLTTHISERHTYVLPAGFKPTIPASAWSQTHALGSVATGIGRV